MKTTWLDDGSEFSTLELIEEGIFYAQLATQESSYRTPLDAIKSDRGYVQEDHVSLAPDTPDLDAICAKFADEHFHDEDEVRFVLEGEGIFDIRSLEDRWMHVLVQKGDLIVVPAKRHHRFTLTEAKTIHCVRLFKDESGWVPHYRPTED